jgi:small GTP-binding protein
MSTSNEINNLYGYDHLFKVILVGDTGVGKTSLLLRFVEDTWEDSNQTTIGIDYRTKQINVRNKNVRLLLYDLSGQERFRSLGNLYYRSCNGLVFVYDVTKRETFENIEHWIKEVDQYIPPGTPKILIGTKNDLEAQREVLYTEGQEFAKKNGMRFFENSARNPNQIDEPFNYLSTKMLLSKEDIKNMFLVQKLDAHKVKKERVKTRECMDFFTWITQKFNLV